MKDESYNVYQGTELVIKPVQLLDGLRAPITAYDGTQTVTTTVWPGSNQPASFTPATDWLATSPNPNTLVITITSAQTASVSPGAYTLLTLLDDAGEMVPAYTCTINILAFAGDMA